ncbi:GNAT family N-acetyltransferase [Streptomyces decoyicus]|uniref:GNAT family N-acetyltransferase n=1 Tax=Streptomyces decoyicus TaxID=249567 RepID=UPI003654D59A
MLTLRELTTDDDQSLTRIYSGASVRHTTGQELTLVQARQKICTALARAAETPRAQWSWSIITAGEMIGLISLRRRSPTMGTLSYILREDTWGAGYASEAVRQVVVIAFTTAGLERLEAMHHPDNPASGRVLVKTGFTLTGTCDRQVEDGTTTAYQVYALPLPWVPLRR